MAKRTVLLCLVLCCMLQLSVVLCQTTSSTIADTSTSSGASTNANTTTSSDTTTDENGSTSAANSTTTATTSTDDSTSSETITSADTTTDLSTETSTNTDTSTTPSIDSSTITSTDTTSTSTTTTTTTTTPAPTTIPTITYESFTWKSSSMTDNPIIFRVPEGYLISATVFGVDMDDGNYLLIEAGDSHTPGATEGRVFANMVVGPLSYLFKTNEVYAFCKFFNETTKYEFTVIFEQTGEVTTTQTTTPTTTVSVPPTEAGDSVYIKVNVSGKYPDAYKQPSTINDFKTCVVEMATSYCDEQNIQLTQTITNDYVMIASIDRCPYTWTRSEICVQIKFKLPIFYNSSEWTGYQLDSNHLEVMWLRQADRNKCFYDKGFSVYDEPDVGNSIMWWAIGISVVLLAFIVLLCFLRTFSMRFKTNGRQTNGRTSSRMSLVSNRKDSFGFLSPHYMEEHQDTPNLFD